MGNKKRKHEAMERFFTDRRRGRDGMYLHAGEDGVRVYLSPPLPASLNAVWQVHHVESVGDLPVLLLHGAAYGRYLASTADPAPRGLVGQRVFQGVYDDQDKDAVFWSPSTVSAENHDVIMQRRSNKFCLRANGKYCKWRTGVSVGEYADQDMMMHWVVEDIPPSPLTPDLPDPSLAAPPGGFWKKILGRTARRIILFVRAADDGSFDPNGWREIEFHGWSVCNLITALAENLNAGCVENIKLCVRAGNLGRLTPLVVNLPNCNDDMCSVVVTASTPALVPLEVQEVLQDEYCTQDHRAASAQLESEMISFKELANNADDSAFVIDLPRNQELVDFVAPSTFTPCGVLSLNKPGAEQKVPPPQGPPQSEVQGPKQIQQEGGKSRSIPAGVEALGEHPTIGVKAAEAWVRGTEFSLHEARTNRKKIEAKYQNLQEEMRKVHQELTKKDRRIKLDKLEKLKTARDGMNNLCDTLQQDLEKAREALQSEILRNR